MGGLVAIAIIGGWVWLWLALAKQHKAKGRGWFSRNMMAGFASSIAAAVAMTVLAAMLPDPDGETARANTPTAVAYTIVSDETLPSIKRSVEVRLAQRPSKQQLEAVAKEIKAKDRRKYERTFISYRLEGQPTDSTYWATTHYNPELEVRIMGFSAEEYTALAQLDIDAKYEQAVGSWLIERGLNHLSVVYSKGEEVFKDDIFSSGAINTSELVAERLDDGSVRLQEPDEGFGEYYTIDPEGNLHFWSEERNYFSAPSRDAAKVQLDVLTVQ